MRIAIPTRFAHRVGGAETYLESIMPALLARGHDVAAWHEAAVAAGDPIIGPAGVALARLRTEPAEMDDALAEIAAWKPDVIFSQGIAAVQLERRMTSVAPMVVMLHAYHGCCISGTKTRSLPSPRPCTRALGPGCLLQFHVRRCGGLSPISMMRDYAGQRVRQQLLRESAAVLTLSEHMRDECIAQGVNPAHVHTVPAFVPGTAFSGWPERGAPDATQRLHLVFAGRMEPLKGAALLVESLTHLPRTVLEKLRLTLVGDGSDRARCITLATTVQARGGLVEFAGWKTPDGCAAIVATADLLVVPSLWPEPFGLIGLEAAAAGLPALAFAVGGIPEWLADDRTGRLLPDAPSAEALAHGVLDCVSDPARLRRWGAEARLRAERRTIGRHIDAVEQLLALACGQRNGQTAERHA